MKQVLALIVAFLAFSMNPAFAQLRLDGTHANSSSGSEAAAVSSPQNIGNPNITLNTTSPALTRGAVDYNTNQASTGPTVFVNPPSADTCSRPGLGVSGGWVSGNAGINVPMGASDTCETRADAINLKVTGAPQEVIKARQCQNPAIAKAYEDAGFPCPRGDKAASADAFEQEAQKTSWWGTAPGAVPAQPKPWMAGG